MSHRITFIVYRPNSMDVSMAALYDSVESSIQVMEFTEFARNAAHDFLVRIFSEDKARRENAKWIKPVEIIALVNGSHLENVSVDTAVDVEAVISSARRAAEA